MELIIQQIAQVFIKTITEKALSEKIHDIDSLAGELEDDCKATVVHIIEAVVASLNRQIRDDKIMRKEQGLLLKEKERAREIYTKVGTIDVSRDYYFDKNRLKYVSVIDHIIGVRPYERIGDTVRAETDCPARASADLHSRRWPGAQRHCAGQPAVLRHADA